VSPKRKNFGRLKRQKAVRSLRSEAGLVRRVVFERWRRSKAPVRRGYFAPRISAGRRGSAARGVQTLGEQSGKLRTKGYYLGLLSLTRRLRAPALGFRKGDQQGCDGEVPQQRRDEPGPARLPRPSTLAAILPLCVSSSERTHLIVPFCLDLVRSSTFIDAPTALPCDTFAANTSPCYYPMRPKSHKLQRNSKVHPSHGFPSKGRGFSFLSLFSSRIARSGRQPCTCRRSLGQVAGELLTADSAAA
jgi:hypothetical protein